MEKYGKTWRPTRTRMLKSGYLKVPCQLNVRGTNVALVVSGSAKVLSNTRIKHTTGKFSKCINCQSHRPKYREVPSF